MRALCFVAVALCGCNTEHLQQLHARIALCPKPDSNPAACNGTIDVGKVPGGIAFDTSIFALDKGTASLEIDEVGIVDGTHSSDVTAKVALPLDVKVGTDEPIGLTFNAQAAPLGPRTVQLTAKSNDDQKSTVTVTIAYEIVPPPHPHIELCDADDASAHCDTNLAVDIGTVRPTESASVAVFVKNTGDAPLHVTQIEQPSDTDIAVTSSTRAGVVNVGDLVPIIVTYTPHDAGDDAGDVVVDSDDPDTPKATAHFTGATAANQAPIAVAVDSVTRTTATTVLVGEEVGVVGTGSSDPEGDPLTYAWTLTAPSGSAASIADPAAENAVFVPDVRGAYTVSLVVTDSLGQQSAPAAVDVTADPHFAFRAHLSWPSGGDLDVHLVASGSAPFSPQDCTFDNRDVPAGDPTSTLDDAVLLDDATASPGSENAVIETPVAGTWEVWVGYFDDGGLGPATATVDIIVDDDTPPIATLSTTLNTTCDLWHAFDVDPLNGTATVVNAPLVSQCH
jgi:hypothetical protein